MLLLAQWFRKFLPVVAGENGDHVYLKLDHLGEKP